MFCNNFWKYNESESCIFPIIDRLIELDKQVIVFFNILSFLFVVDLFSLLACYCVELGL